MKRILLALVLTVSTSQAGVTLDWEINLLDKVNIYENASYDSADYSIPYTLNNGDLYTYTKFRKDSLSEHKIVVVDKYNGNVKYVFNTESVEALNFHYDGSFSHSEYGFDNGNYVPSKYHFHFLNQNGNYEHVEVDSFNKANTGAPVLNQSLSDIVYLTLNYTSIIRKYTITSDNPTPTLSSQTSSGFNQDNYVINWDSSLGVQYQIQSSTDLTNWVNVGSSIVGTGETMTWANHITNSQAFYRVVED